MLTGKPLSKLQEEGEVATTIAADDLLMISRKRLVSYDSKAVTYETLRDDIAEYIGFKPETEYQLSVICDGSMGSVVGGGKYKPGSTVSVGAFPKSGYVFEKWEGLDSEVAVNPHSFQLFSDKTVTAIFKEDPTPPPPVLIPITVTLDSNVVEVPV